jgi:hypothetical protein
MPGPYPGIVAEVHLPGALQGGQPTPGAAKRMLAAGLCSLTGEKDPRDAWRRFVTPGERIGIKFNPVGHKVSGVTWDVIGAVVEGLESSGIPRKDMLVWHRFNDEHAQTYKPELVHPGVEAYLLNWFIVKDGKNTPGGFERWMRAFSTKPTFRSPTRRTTWRRCSMAGPAAISRASSPMAARTAAWTR